MKTKKSVVEYDEDGMIEMLNELYDDMIDVIVDYAKNDWEENDDPTVMFEEWWDDEDTSTLERDLCGLANEFFSDIKGEEGIYGTLDEYLYALDEIVDEVCYVNNFGYISTLLDDGEELSELIDLTNNN